MSLFGEDARGDGVDGVGALALLFGEVDGGPGGRVDDDRRFELAQDSADALGLNLDEDRDPRAEAVR